MTLASALCRADYHAQPRWAARPTDNARTKRLGLRRFEAVFSALPFLIETPESEAGK